MDEFDLLGSVFSAALIEVISTSTGESLNVLSRECDTGFAHMLGAMSLNGKKSGMLFISSKESDMRLLCSKMIGVLPSEVTADEVKDALGEFVNMTAGNAKLRLSDTDFLFALSPPFIIEGENMSVTVKHNTHVSSVVLGNGDISLELKVLY